MKKVMATICLQLRRSNTTIDEGKEEGDDNSYCRHLFFFATPAIEEGDGSCCHLLLFCNTCHMRRQW